MCQVLCWAVRTVLALGEVTGCWWRQMSMRAMLMHVITAPLGTGGGLLEHLFRTDNPVLGGRGCVLEGVLSKWRPEDELETPWPRKWVDRVEVGIWYREEHARQREQRI